MNWNNRVTNPPSIPSHGMVFGYEENDKGELVRQTNIEKMHSGVKTDTVGPGEYEVVQPLGGTKKGPTWHVPKSSLKKEEAKLEAGLPGPGYYNADKVDIFPIYKYKPSSVFVSKVARDKHIRSSQTLPSGKPVS